MDKKRVLIRFAFLFVALVVILRSTVYLIYFLNWHVYFFSDNAVYAILAKRFLNGNFLEVIHPIWNPGFPVATIPFYLLTGKWEEAQILVSMISAVLLIILMCFFIKKFSLRLAVTVACITAFSAGLEKLVVFEGITEPLYLLITYSAVFCGFLALIKNKFFLYILTGALFAVSYLIRTDMVGFLSAFLVFAIFFFLINKIFQHSKEQPRFFIAKILSLFIVFFLVNLPYITVVSHQLGKFSLSGKYVFIGSGPPFQIVKNQNRLTTFMQDVGSVDYPNYNSSNFDSGRAWRSLIKTVEDGSFMYFSNKAFGESLKIYQSNSDLFLRGILFYITILGGIIGLILKEFRLLTIYLFFLWLGEFVWVIVFMSPIPRYLSFALPFFFYLQALSVYSISCLIRKMVSLFMHNINNKIIDNLIFLSVLGLFLYNFSPVNMYKKLLFDTQNFISGIHFEGFESNKIVGEWVKSQNIKVIGTRHEAIGFYGNAKIVYFPLALPDDVVKYMKAWGVEYLIVRGSDVGNEMFRPISNPEYKHPDLTITKVFDDNDGTLVWKIHLTDYERKNNQRILRGDK